MVEIAAFLLFFALGCLWAIYSENKEWNNGACSCNKGFWISFDMDSSGAIGYRCSDPRCNKVTWQSWRKRLSCQ